MTIETLKNVGYLFANPLLNGFEFDVDSKNKRTLGINHFRPCNTWQKNTDHTAPCRVKDLTTGDVYIADYKLRKKCIALIPGTLTLQVVGLFLNFVNRIFKVALLAQLWYPPRKQENDEIPINVTCKARLKECGMDILRIAATPLVLVGLFFSALYGATISPNDGRKLYAAFERFVYSGGYENFSSGGNKYFSTDLIVKKQHDHFLAPCFQPIFSNRPVGHLFHGDPNDPNAW